MFSFQSQRNYYCFNQKLFYLTLIVVILVNCFAFIEMKSHLRQLLRHKRSSDEYQSITDPHLLAKQYSLVNTYGGVDILGDVRQYKTGKIDTRDFGQNIHFGRKDRIRPGEKEQALADLLNQGLMTLWRQMQQALEDA